MGWGPEFESMKLRGWEYEQIVVANANIGFTSTKLLPTSGNANGKKAVKAHVRVSGADVRYRLDGTVPDANTGMLAENGDQFVLSGYENLVAFRAIRTAAANAALDVNYYYFNANGAS